MWLSPDASDTSLWTMLRAGGLPLACSLGPAATWRLLSYSRKVGRLCQQHCGFPHWYLLTLGVVPEHQRRVLEGACCAASWHNWTWNN